MFKKLIAESTAKSPWLFHINAGSCNGCDIELVSVITPRYDAERLGFKLTGTPRHADIVVVTGPVTKQTLPRVLRSIAQVPEPRCIVTMGSCPQSGNVFRGSYSVAGPLSEDNMRQFNVDKAFIGVAGITEDGISDFNIEEASLRRQVIRNARQVIALADHSKFGIRAVSNICALSDIDVLITDEKAPANLLARIEKSGVRVVIVKSE